jgi:hypothetical protein
MIPYASHYECLSIIQALYLTLILQVMQLLQLRQDLAARALIPRSPTAYANKPIPYF